MTLWLKACIALAKDLNSVSSTQGRWLTTHLGLQNEYLHSGMHICKHTPTHICTTESKNLF